MRSNLLPLLSTVALACATAFPSVGRSQAKREIATELDKPGYLCPLDVTYYLDAKVPEQKAPADAPMQVLSFSVHCKFVQQGNHEIRDVKLECPGVTYTVPDHKVLVLGDVSKTPGLTIRTAPDPNGSGNVELVVDWSGAEEPKPDYINLCDFEKRPKGIDMLRSGGGGGGSEGFGYEWYLDVMLRNTTDTPYTVKPELFKNVPPVKEWPEIVIPPAKDK